MPLAAQRLSVWLLVLAPLTLTTVKIAHADAPFLELSPTTPVALHLETGTTATVRYLVTNNTRRAEAITMLPIRGVEQVGGAGARVCAPDRVLDGLESCELTLTITADEVPRGGINGGPVLCEANNPAACVRPDPAYALSISVDVQSCIAQADCAADETCAAGACQR